MMNELEKLLINFADDIQEEENSSINSFLLNFKRSGTHLSRSLQEKKTFITKNFQTQNEEFSGKLLNLLNTFSSIDNSNLFQKESSSKILSELENEREQKEEALKDLESLSQEFYSLQQKNEGSELMMNEGKKKMENLIQQRDIIINAKDEIIKKLNEKCRLEREQNKKIFVQISQLRQYQKDLESKMRVEQEKLIFENEKLQNEIAILNQKNEDSNELDETLKNKDNIIEELSQQVYRFQNEINKLKVSIFNDQNYAINSPEENEKTTNEIDDINNEELLRLIQIKEDSINKFLNKNVELEKKNEKLQKKVENLKETIKFLQENPQDDTEGISLKQEIENVNILNQKMKKTISQLKEKNENQENLIKELKNSSKVRNVSQKDEKFDILMREVKNLSNSFKLNNSKGESDHLEKNVQTDNNNFIENVKLKEEIALLKSFLEKREEEIMKMQNKGGNFIEEEKIFDKKIISILQGKLKVAQKYLFKLSKETTQLNLNSEKRNKIIEKQKTQNSYLHLQISEQSKTINQMKILIEKALVKNNLLKEECKKLGNYQMKIKQLNRESNTLKIENKRMKKIINKQENLIRTTVFKSEDFKCNENVNKLFYK